jgi:hypothetical protein
VRKYLTAAATAVLLALGFTATQILRLGEDASEDPGRQPRDNRIVVVFRTAQQAAVSSALADVFCVTVNVDGTPDAQAIACRTAQDGSGDGFRLCDGAGDLKGHIVELTATNRQRAALRQLINPLPGAAVVDTVKGYGARAAEMASRGWARCYPDAGVP